MRIEPFFDERTSTLTHVVFDEVSRDAVIIDPVLDYEPGGGRVWTESVEKVAAFVDAQQLKVHFVLETHAHADHLSGSQWLKKRFGAEVAVSHRRPRSQPGCAPAAVPKPSGEHRCRPAAGA